MYSDEIWFCLQHHKGRIRIWKHLGECMLPASIRLLHTGPLPGVMVWNAVGWMSLSFLVCIESILQSGRKMSVVLRPSFDPCEMLYFSKMMHNLMLTVFFGFSLIQEKFGYCPGLQVIQISQSMAAQQLAGHHTPAITAYELRHLAEAVSATVPVHNIQSLYDSRNSSKYGLRSLKKTHGRYSQA